MTTKPEFLDANSASLNEGILWAIGFCWALTTVCATIAGWRDHMGLAGITVIGGVVVTGLLESLWVRPCDCVHEEKDEEDEVWRSRQQ